MDEAVNLGKDITLVARKACFGLPTACPSCLPVYIYLKFARIPFNLGFNLMHPDSAAVIGILTSILLDQIPYVESGTYVAYNNEKGGLIESLKEDRIVNLDSEVHSIPKCTWTKAMVTSWLADALMYELWVASAGSSAQRIYYSDLPWPIGKFLYFKQIHIMRQLLGITKDNAARREEEIYKRATIAYGALSTMLGDQSFFIENRPTSLDAVFLGHALFTLQALPETSVLRSKLLEHSNLVRYSDKLKMEFLETSSSSSIPPPADPSSSFSKQGTSNWSSKPKSKPKREKTEEEKKFKKRAKYFFVTQLVAVLVFMSLLGRSDEAQVELDDDDDDMD